MLRWQRMLRWHTFRIVLFTSLIWIALGFGFLVYYSDCGINGDGFNCGTGGKQARVHQLQAHRQLQNQLPPEALPQHQKSYENGHNNNIINSSPLPPYQSHQLVQWSPVKLINNPKNWPGENGVGVIIPKKDEALKNEKFTINQFNILASDQIALNRSIRDVRMEQ